MGKVRKFFQNVLPAIFLASTCLFTIDTASPVHVYMYPDLPLGATFDEITGAFTWTPTSDQIGEHWIRFGVTDGEFNDWEDIKITVLPEDTQTPDPLPPVGEVVEARTETSKTTHNGNGSFSLDVSIGPVHYQDGLGDWQDIDPQFVPAQAPWDWEMSDAGYSVRVLEDFTAGQIIELEKGGLTVELQPMAMEWTNDIDQVQPISMPVDVIPLITNPEVNLLPVGDPARIGTISWPDGYGTGVDFQWKTGPATLEKLITVDTLGSLPAPQQYIIDGGNPVLRYNMIFDHDPSLDIFVDGLLWDESTTTQSFEMIEFRSGVETLWAFMPLMYWDSTFDRGQSVATLEKRGNSLYTSVRVPYDWLQTATYPVYIDHDIEVATAAAGDDGYRYKPNDSCSSINSSILFIGNEQFTPQFNDGFARFTGVTIPDGSTIDLAHVRIYVYQENSANVTANIYAVDQLAPTSPTTCGAWASQPNTTAFASYNNGDTGWEEDIVTSIVQELEDSYDYSSGSSMLFKWLETETSGSDDYDLADGYETAGTNQPQLHIDYTAAGPVAPTVTTQAASSVEETTATLNGNITDTGGENASVRGFDYDTDSGEPYASNWNESGSFGTGAYTHGLTGLTQGELYYYRAYATNSGGTGTGAEQKFLTKPVEPNSLSVSPTASGILTLTWVKGTGAQNTYIRGKAGSYPTDRADGYLVYNNTGTTTTDTGLTGGTVYYYRAWSYATEGGESQYSDLYDQDNETAVTALSITTVAADDILSTSATLNANLTNLNGADDADERGFVWGTSTLGDPGNVAPSGTAYDDYWTESGSFSTGTFDRGITSLDSSETYYFRAAVYSDQIDTWTYGSELTFDTLMGPPTNFVATYINDYQVDLTWTKDAGATNTMIRAKYGDWPTDETDGRQVYFSTGTSVSDTDVDLDMRDSPVYYRAWSEDGASGYSTEYAEDSVGGSTMILLGLFLLACAVSYIAVRSAFPLYKYAASVTWIGILLYIKDNPPSPLSEGDPAHVVIMLALIVLSIVFMLAQLGRSVTRSRNQSGTFSVQENSFNFKLPDFMRSNQYHEGKRRADREQENDEYRERIHRALNQHEGRERRRR